MKYCMTMPIPFDATQYSTRPTGKIRLRNPKKIGNMSVIIFCVLACCGSIDGDWVIFCCTYMVRPDKPTKKKARKLPDCIGCSARSMPPRRKGS